MIVGAMSVSDPRRPLLVWPIVVLPVAAVTGYGLVQLMQEFGRWLFVGAVIVGVAMCG